ncbi:MAG: hypothetical protein CMJ58_08940 [Planctomycetaceae bacterium]|nr:hypothetical protein [Planctomycetaceae bacterium]
MILLAIVGLLASGGRYDGVARAAAPVELATLAVAPQSDPVASVGEICGSVVALTDISPLPTAEQLLGGYHLLDSVLAYANPAHSDDEASVAPARWTANSASGASLLSLADEMPQAAAPAVESVGDLPSGVTLPLRRGAAPLVRGGDSLISTLADEPLAAGSALDAASLRLHAEPQPLLQSITSP